MIPAARRRLLFTAFSLRRGGAERVTTTLLRYLAALDRYDLHLALLEQEGPFLDLLPDCVTVHGIGTRRIVPSLSRMYRLLDGLRPDVVFSNGFPINLLTSSLKPFLRSSPRLVLREVNVLDVLLRRGLSRVVLRQVARRTFRSADAIICQSKFMQDDLRAGLNLDPHKLVTIFNPVDFDAIAQLAGSANPFAGHGPGPHVVGVGYLARKKGFDRVLEAFPALKARAPTARLWLVGGGPEAESLQRQAERLGLSECVTFVGPSDNPYVWMRHADLFVLASRHEGTPNVLLEAIACSAPIVVVDHPGGTREVMQRTGQEWRIVSDLSAWDQRWFERPPATVLARARSFLDVSHVARQYLAVLDNAVQQREAA